MEIDTQKLLGLRCGGCAAFNSGVRTDGMGQCRYGAPQVVLVDGRPKAYWPLVHRSEWCLKHSSLEVSQAG